LGKRKKVYRQGAKVAKERGEDEERDWILEIGDWGRGRRLTAKAPRSQRGAEEEEEKCWILNFGF
jgi:hypothetical protein